MSQTPQFDARIRKSVESAIATIDLLRSDAVFLATISRIAQCLIQAFRQGNKVLLFGNGGSANDAQHIATELVGRFAFDRPALAALSLAESFSSVTAISNDHGFEQVFSRQIEALGRPGDVAIAISTSGNSPNVLHGVATANKADLFTIGLTGHSGGRLRSLVRECVCVPSDDTPRIQECHTLIGHILSQIVEQEMFGQRESATHT
ncbi:MAG TPA: SIS domain-containing protein [Candidatus Eremiobacteraceae bacterium]|nr:SIS domain-containing protein [Candidatus Eremiobacteraceae bacterium]